MPPASSPVNAYFCRKGFCMSIEVKNITKIYGTQKAVNDASFSIKKGEIVGLLGPNGAGKSTLMKMISCFIPPTKGTASVSGFDILENSLEVRRRLGYLPEHNPLYLDMYVTEYLEHVAGLYKIKKPLEKAREMIEITGLSPEKHKKIGALSKGYRQRVGLAQAMIHDPEVLILDEPTSGLDPNQLIEIRNLIRKIGSEKTVILSTHIMQEVEAICDRVIIINKGTIVADDSTKNLASLSKGNTRITLEINVKAKPDFLKAISGVQKINEIADKKFELICSAEKDIREEIFEQAVANNVKVLSMQQESRSMEDVFHELTQHK